MARRPVEIIYLEMHQTKENAMKREREIKKLTRAEKLALSRQVTQTPG